MQVDEQDAKRDMIQTVRRSRCFRRRFKQIETVESAVVIATSDKGVLSVRGIKVDEPRRLDVRDSCERVGLQSGYIYLGIRF